LKLGERSKAAKDVNKKMDSQHRKASVKCEIHRGEDQRFVMAAVDMFLYFTGPRGEGSQTLVASIAGNRIRATTCRKSRTWEKRKWRRRGGQKVREGSRCETQKGVHVEKV